MFAINKFLRSLAQAFGISSPQQVKPVSRPLNPPARPGPVSIPSRPQTATTKKDE